MSQNELNRLSAILLRSLEIDFYLNALQTVIEIQILRDLDSFGFPIMKTRLFKIYWKFHHQKLKVFWYKFWYFPYFCSKHRLWVSLEPPLTSAHNIWFWAEIRKNNVYPCKPQFYYIKVGFKGSKLYSFSWCILFYKGDILITCTW